MTTDKDDDYAKHIQHCIVEYQEPRQIRELREQIETLQQRLAELKRQEQMGTLV